MKHELLNGPTRVQGKAQTLAKSTATRITEELLESLQTKKGGFTRDTLAMLGVSRPPEKGWKKKLLGKKVIVEEKEAVVAPAKAGKVVMIDPKLRYDGPEPSSPEFDSRIHGLLAPPRVTTLTIQ